MNEFTSDDFERLRQANMDLIEMEYNEDVGDDMMSEFHIMALFTLSLALDVGIGVGAGSEKEDELNKRIKDVLLVMLGNLATAYSMGRSSEKGWDS